MWYILLFLFLLLFALWNITLIGYKERDLTPLESDESQCFCEKAKSIILVQHADQAILLIHGFPTTPYLYCYSAPRFFESGMDVYAPLLPGFGTDVKKFEQTNFTQWFSYLCSYYEKLRAQYKTVYVLGTSMGGLMTLKLGETYCASAQAPDKLVTIAAPVVYNSIRDRIFTNKQAYFMRTVALFKTSKNPKTICRNPDGEDGNEDWVGYGGTFYRSGLSLMYAMKEVRKNLPLLTCPLFSIHDINDKTIPFKNLHIIQKENKSSCFKSLETEMGAFNHSRHALLMYHSIQKELTDTIIEFLQDKEHHHG